MKQFARLGLLALVASLAACSVFEGDKIDYRSSTKAPSLEVPPDLTQLSRDSRYVVPGGVVSASGMQQAQGVAPGTPTAAANLGDVRVERIGNQRWLVVGRSPDQLWDPVRDFWKENGFALVLDQASLGIMETDWAENRAKIPQDMIRGMLGKVIDNLYSTPERDRFRTRLERSGNGTEIFISHRGMLEVYTNAQREGTVWTPRPADPELEAEFLRRLMVKLGAPAEQAKTLVAQAPAAKTIARVITAEGRPAVQIDEGFDRAWRRVGLSLDRTGFTVEDRDRAQGTYFVRYVAPNPDKADKGFFARIFSRDDVGPPVKYRISLKSQGEQTTVSVLNTGGAPETSPAAQRIVQLIADDLK